MYKPVEYIETIKDGGNNVSYLYNKKENTIIPLEYSGNNSYPEGYNTIYRIVQAFKATIEKVQIYKYYGENFYTYIKIFSDNQNFEININMEEALNISKEYKIPIEISSEIYETIGFKITKEMILNSLEG